MEEAAVLGLLCQPQTKVIASLGNLSVWYSTKNSIGRWSSSSIKVYMEKLNTNTSFTFIESLTNATSQWHSALGVTLTANVNAPASPIRYFGGTASEVTAAGLSVVAGDNGRTTYSYYYEGTWYLYPLDTTKTGNRHVNAQGYILDKNRTASAYIKTALHELGHSLGWEGHSSNVSDVMFGSGSEVTTLTNRDKNHLSQVY